MKHYRHVAAATVVAAAMTLALGTSTPSVADTPERPAPRSDVLPLVPSPDTTPQARSPKTPKGAASRMPAQAQSTHAIALAANVVLPSSGCKDYPLEYAVVPSLDYYMGYGYWLLDMEVWDPSFNTTHGGSVGGFNLGDDDPTDGTLTFEMCAGAPTGTWYVGYAFLTDDASDSGSTQFTVTNAPAPAPAATPKAAVSLTSATAQKRGKKVAGRFSSTVKVGGTAVRSKPVKVWAKAGSRTILLGTSRTNARGVAKLNKTVKSAAVRNNKVRVRSCVDAGSVSGKKYLANCSAWKSVPVRR